MNKNKLTILFIILLLLSGGIWFYLNQAKYTEQNINEKEKVVKRGEVEQAEEVDTSDWIEYKNDNYSIRIPNDFILTKTPLAGEGDNIIKPISTSNSNYPRLHISFDNYKSELFDLEKTIEIKKSSLLGRKYKDRLIAGSIINGEKAWTQVGISEFKVEEGVVVEGALNMKDILFTKGSTIFIIGLQYENTDKYVAEQFEEIITTFKFIE